MPKFSRTQGIANVPQNEAINKKKSKTWFINWFRYFEAYLELARVGLLQLAEQKYPPKNLFKKDAIYGDQILLVPIIWSLKHSIELLLKFIDIRITQEFFSVHNNKKLHNEIKASLSELGISNSQISNELIILSDKYFKLKFWNSFVTSSGCVYDGMNDVFRYPESKADFILNVEELHKVTEENRLELKEDIERLNRLSLKLYGEITRAKIRKNK